MFSNSDFNKDISNWDISNVKKYDNIFNNCPIKLEYTPSIRVKLKYLM